jgi:hypothetical protein
MSNFVQPRDQDELEGTLLPIAWAVPTNDETEGLLQNDGDAAGTTPTRIPVTAATPVDYFEYDDAVDNQIDELQERPASAVPLADTFANPNDEVRMQILRGERTGRIAADSEIEDIQRANRTVRAVNYFSSKQVNEGNRRASRLSQEENRHGWSGPTNELSRPPATAPNAATNTTREEAYPNPKKGTFGKEYEIAEYETSDYDTSDYEISEYKSMYDN